MKSSSFRPFSDMVIWFPDSVPFNIWNPNMWNVKTKGEKKRREDHTTEEIEVNQPIPDFLRRLLRDDLLDLWDLFFWADGILNK